MRHLFHIRLWPLLLGVLLFLSTSPADAQNRGGRNTSTVRKSKGTNKATLKAPATPTHIGDTERTILDLLYFPFSCLNAYMPTREIAQQEVMEAFGTCENINGCPGLHAGGTFDFTYRGVPIGMCYYDWYDNRTWYHFYLDTKAEADQLYNHLLADIRNAGITLTRDKVYGDMSNRSHPVSVFKWVNVTPPVKVTEIDPSNMDLPSVVGKYKVEFGIMKKR